MLYSLKWYLLGKHAAVALSQNKNTEDTIGSRLLDTECLSATIFDQSEILQEIETEYSICPSEIVLSQEQIDLLQIFENEVPILLEKKCKLVIHCNFVILYFI